jgi:hypothetical protein
MVANKEVVAIAQVQAMMPAGSITAFATRSPTG